MMESKRNNDLNNSGYVEAALTDMGPAMLCARKSAESQFISSQTALISSPYSVCE